MKPRLSLTMTFAALLLALFLFPRPAHAYLDPGTGSYIIQIALAAFVGAAFAVRLFWGRIKAFFKRVFARQEVESLDDD